MFYEKRFFLYPSDLKTYLEGLGFVIDTNNHMRWGYADQNSDCYWVWNDTSGLTEFIDSNGNSIFYDPITRWPTRNPVTGDIVTFRTTGVVFCALKNNGCIINFKTFDASYLEGGEGSTGQIIYVTRDMQNELTITCKLLNNAEHYSQNALIACTPAEEDGKWRYSWRNQMYSSDITTPKSYFPPSFEWIIDNGVAGNTGMLPSVQRWDVQFALALAKVYLPQGFISNNIYTQIMGDNEEPGMVYTINGQRYISLCPENLNEAYYRYDDGTGQIVADPDAPQRDSLLYRPICFLLADDEQTVNDHTSTQLYNQNTLYRIGDYCIYNGLLYICTTNIDSPEPWDIDHWEVTTVSTELAKN